MGMKKTFRLHFQYDTTQKMKFSIKYFFSKCDQIHSFERIWPHLLKKSLMENLIFCTVQVSIDQVFYALYYDQYKLFFNSASVLLNIFINSASEVA